MSRSVWKWIFGISVTVLILLMLFTVCIWAMGNAAAALTSAVMSYTDSEAFAYNGITFAEFMSNFVGSPIFYACIVDAAAIAVSAVMLSKKK